MSAAEGAARRLSVDVANLSYRVAMLDSAIEMIREAAAQVQPSTWRRGSVAVGPADLEGKQDTMTQAVLTAEQADVIATLIAVIGDVL
jgi:hypothetical protein